jgi:hypothetical protein
MNPPFDKPPPATEGLARFVFQSNHIRGDRSIKHNAFLPDLRGETSVHRVDGLSHDEICDAGRAVAAESNRKEPKGWGSFLSGVAYDEGLTVRPDPPPERHAVLVGWPPDEDPRRLDIANELAARAGKLVSFEASPQV